MDMLNVFTYTYAYLFSFVTFKRLFQCAMTFYYMVIYQVYWVINYYNAYDKIENGNDTVINICRSALH